MLVTCDEKTLKYVNSISILSGKIIREHIKIGENEGTNDGIVKPDLSNMQKLSWKILPDGSLQISLDYSWKGESAEPNGNNGFNPDGAINFDAVVELFKRSEWQVKREKTYKIENVDDPNDNSIYVNTDMLVITIPEDYVKRILKPSYSRTRALKYKPTISE